MPDDQRDESPPTPAAHDGAQTQADDGAAGGVGADETRDAHSPGARAAGAVAAAPPVPVAAGPTASSAPGQPTEPPGNRHGGNRQPSNAPTGRPDGEVDTRA